MARTSWILALALLAAPLAAVVVAHDDGTCAMSNDDLANSLLAATSPLELIAGLQSADSANSLITAATKLASQQNLAAPLAGNTVANASDFPVNTPTTITPSGFPSVLNWTKMWILPVGGRGSEYPTQPQEYLDAGYINFTYVSKLPPVGFFFFVKYSEASPLGVYEEAFYAPGAFTLPGCVKKPTLSCTRILVNDRGTQKAGRCIWGLPKQLAFIDFPDDDTKGVTVTDPDTGKIVLQLNVTDKPPVFSLLPGNLGSPVPALRVLQWPVSGVPGSPCSTHPNDPAYQSNLEALAQNPVAPLEWDLKLDFKLNKAQLGYPSGVYIDPVWWTGSSKPLTVLPIVQKLRDGAGLLTEPVVVKC